MGSSRQRPTDTRKTKAPNRTTNSTANTSAVSPSYPWGRPTLPLPDVMSHNYMSRPSISPRTLPTTLMPRLTQVHRHESRIRRARPAVIERRATCHTEADRGPLRRGSSTRQGTRRQAVKRGRRGRRRQPWRSQRRRQQPGRRRGRQQGQQRRTRSQERAEVSALRELKTKTNSTRVSPQIATGDTPP